MAVTLTDKEVRKIMDSIEFIYEVGYKDKTALLIEAMCAISTIETVMDLAEHYPEDDTKVYARKEA